MTVAVKSTGSFRRDKALAESLNVAVVLSSDADDCVVMQHCNGNLVIGSHPSAASYYSNTGADGDPWFSFVGVAYVQQDHPSNLFEFDELDEAEEAYDLIMGHGKSNQVDGR